VAVDKHGVIMVDAQFAPMARKLKAAIANLTKEPIRYLVNTHYHPDHSGGNAEFAQTNATIVAHTQVLSRLMDPPGNPMTGQKGMPAPMAALPTITYSDQLALRLDGQTAQLHHIADAHTDGDTYVYFPDANVLSTGDLLSVNRYPNIDLNVGGSVDGMIAADDVLLKLVNAQTKIVPGHGAVGSKADLQAFRDMLAKARELMVKEIAAGKTEEQMMEDKPLASLDAKWSVAGDMFSARFPRTVYQSLKKQAATH